MENNTKKIQSEKCEIKAIIDDIRKLIATYGSNHDEKIMSTLKKYITNQEGLGVMKKMIVLKT